MPAVNIFFLHFLTFFPLGLCTETYLLVALSSLLSIWVVPGALNPDVYYLAPRCLVKMSYCCTEVPLRMFGPMACVILGSEIQSLIERGPPTRKAILLKRL